MQTKVIAEAGSNHNGNLKQAFKLIDVACQAKASIVKFQTYSSNTLYCKNTPDFAGHQNVNQLIKDLEIDRGWQKDLKLYCDDNDIEFMSTPFDEQAVDELYNLGVKRFKIAGFESTDPRLICLVAKTQLPLIISAGIGSSLNKIQSIIEWVKSENPSPDITVLHCNNAYPTPYEDINLSQIPVIKKTFNVKVGLSDHTEGILVPPLAVMMGAGCIEKHFTLSRYLPGPDHPFAIEPSELEQMVKKIIIAEKCLGIKKDNITKSEEKFQKAMRSVVSSKTIKEGEFLTSLNTTTKRPFLSGAIPAEEYFYIRGRKVKEDIEADTIIMWKDLKEDV
jgi:sialic acid synthase SpsE